MAAVVQGRLSVTVLRAVRLGPSGAEEGDVVELSEPFCTFRLRDGAACAVPSDRLGGGGSVDWRSTVAFTTDASDTECSIQLHDAALLPGYAKYSHTSRSVKGPIAKVGRLLSLFSVGASLDLPPEMDGYGESPLSSERASALMSQPSLIGSARLPLHAARQKWADSQEVTVHCAQGRPVARLTLLLGHVPLRMTGYVQLRASRLGGWQRCRAELCANGFLFLYNTGADRARPDQGIRACIQLKDVTAVEELPGRAVGVRLEEVATKGGSGGGGGKQRRQRQRYDLRVPRDCVKWLRCLKEGQKAATREMPRSSAPAAFLERFGLRLPGDVVLRKGR